MTATATAAATEVSAGTQGSSEVDSRNVAVDLTIATGVMATASGFADGPANDRACAADKGTRPDSPLGMFGTHGRAGRVDANEAVDKEVEFDLNMDPGGEVAEYRNHVPVYGHYHWHNAPVSAPGTALAGAADESHAEVRQSTGGRKADGPSRSDEPAEGDMTMVEREAEEVLRHEHGEHGHDVARVAARPEHVHADGPGRLVEVDRPLLGTIVAGLDIGRSAEVDKDVLDGMVMVLVLDIPDAEQSAVWIRVVKVKLGEVDQQVVVEGQHDEEVRDALGLREDRHRERRIGDPETALLWRSRTGWCALRPRRLTHSSQMPAGAEGTGHSKCDVPAPALHPVAGEGEGSKRHTLPEDLDGPLAGKTGNTRLVWVAEEADGWGRVVVMDRVRSRQRDDMARQGVAGACRTLKA